MPDSPSQPLNEEWFTKRDIALRVFACQPQNFDKTYRPCAPPDAVRKVGTSVFIHARKLIDALVERARTDVGEADDALMGGSDSPGLERYRAAKADLTEMERDRQRKQLFRLMDVEPRLMQLSGLLRGVSENLRRRHGNEAGDLLDEVLNEWERGLAAVFSSDDGPDSTDVVDPDGAGGTVATAPDDAAVR